MILFSVHRTCIQFQEINLNIKKYTNLFYFKGQYLISVIYSLFVRRKFTITLYKLKVENNGIQERLNS